MKNEEAQISERQLLLVASASLVLCSCAFAITGAAFTRFAGGEPSLALATALIAAGLMAAALFSLRKVVRRVFAPINEIRSHLLEAVERNATPSRRFDSENRATGLSQLVDELVRISGECAKEGAEYEFANKALLRERDRLCDALNSVEIGILVVAEGERIRFANKACERFLSLPVEEATGRVLKDCVTDSRLLPFLQDMMENQGDSDGRIELQFDEPTDMVFSVTSGDLSKREENEKGRCFIFQNVTAGKKAERAREEFVNSVAHELRTPLTSIKAYAEMLVDGEVADEETEREFYNVIYEETDRLNRLIDNLLNISKIEFGHLVLNRTPTRLKKLLEDSISVVESQVKKKNLQLTLDLPDRLPAMQIDKDMMNVAFVNLLGNAVKYTPESGSISIAFTQNSDEILVHINDTGIGIDEEDLPRIFDKFFRSNGQANGKVVGSGLGLCIARQIVRLHAGDIRVSSRPGEGSQFSIVLPRSALVKSLGDYDHDA